LRAHYPPGFNVSVTIGPRNAGDAVAIVEKVHTLGAKTLMLRPQYPAGEAARGSELCDRDTFARAVLAAKTRAQELGLSLDAPNPLEEGEKSFEGFGCVAARAVLGITPNGRVTPCLNLASSFESGSVREKSLADLWRGGRSFVLVRGQQPNAQCASCKHYDTCRGGCRVRALFAGNGLNGPDSWCHYEPKDPVHSERAERVEAVSLPVVPSRATESL
jgi:radical SAM protein with 4Fe4S-binding SPASM domain